MQSGIHVNWSAEVKAADDSGRRHVHTRNQALCHFLIRNNTRSEAVYHQRNRLRHTDCIGKLNLRLGSEPCRHKVFRHISGQICPASVHFGRILSRERSASMRKPSAICIHDYFSSGQPSITVRTTNHKQTGGIDMDMPYRVQGKTIFFQDRRDHILPDIFPEIANPKSTAVHDRNYYRVNSKNISKRIIFHSNLGLSIRAKKRIASCLPGQTAAKSPRQGNGQRHALFCLRTGAPKHHTLIPGTANFVTGSQRDIRRLSMNPALDLNRIRVKSLSGMYIPNTPDDTSGNLGIIHFRICSNLSADQAEVCCNHCFAGYPGSRILAKALIQNRVGYSVSYLIRMTGGDTFRGKKSSVH